MIKKRSSNKGLLLYIGLVPFLVFAIFPLIWMFVTSLKTNSELLSVSGNPFLVKMGITWEHYIHLFSNTNYLRWYANTFLVSGVATALSVIISLFAGYSLARLKFKGSRATGTGIFLSYLVPPSLLFISLVAILVKVKIFDTVYALIFSYPTFLIPFCTWLLIGYFGSIPREIEDAAMVDGASRFQCILKVVIPMALPGIIASTVFSFLTSWSHLLYAIVFVSHSNSKVICSGVISELIRVDVYSWGPLMAAGVLACLPAILVFSVFLDYYVVGLTQGATKY